MMPNPTPGAEPARALKGLLAYLADEDCASFAAGQAAALLGRHLVMLSGGRLASAGDGRPVRPYLFLGRSADGRLAYLCIPLERRAPERATATR